MRRVTQEELDKGENITPNSFQTIIKIDDSTVVKSGTELRLSEAAAMRFVSENTTIPVPKVYGAYRDESLEKSFIIMEYIKGQRLEDIWNDLTLDEKTDITRQLKEIIDQLRALRGEYIGCADNSACEDVLFSETEHPKGPFNSEEAFTQGMMDTLLEKRDNAYIRLICGMLKATMKGHSIVFTHGDFLPRNILVKDGKVVGILDWEMAGWYPEYWEYCKIMYRPNFTKDTWFKDQMVENITAPYYPELAVMMQVREVIW